MRDSTSFFEKETFVFWDNARSWFSEVWEGARKNEGFRVSFPEKRKVRSGTTSFFRAFVFSDGCLDRLSHIMVASSMTFFCLRLLYTNFGVFSFGISKEIQQRPAQKISFTLVGCSIETSTMLSASLLLLALIYNLISCHGLAGPNVVANMPSIAVARCASAARTKAALRLSGGGGSAGEAAELRDYGSEMSALFGNIRIPAALFAGASAGAAFALPLGTADGLKRGFVKRTYALLMMSALSCQLLAIIVATLSMGTIAVSAESRKAACLADYIEEYFDLSWVTARWNFLAGIFAFVVGMGIRAWLVVTCPIFGNAALGIIASSTVLAVGFVEDNERKRRSGGVSKGLLGLTIRYATSMLKKAAKDPLFALGCLLSAATWGYVVYNLPHVWQYLEMH